MINYQRMAQNKLFSKIIYFVLIFNILFLNNCKLADKNEKIKHIYGLNGIIIGDSIFNAELLTKVIITDTIFGIDSIVYKRYTSQTLKSINTFKAGVPIFENLELYNNGNIKVYKFIDIQERFSYERYYNENGKLDSVLGKPFFCCILDGIKNRTVYKDSIINAYLYAPTPPDTKTRIYTKFRDGTEENFKRRSYLNNLFRETIRATQLGIEEWDIRMEFIDKDTITDKTGDFFFKVVAPPVASVPQ